MLTLIYTVVGITSDLKQLSNNDSYNMHTFI